MKIYSFRWNRDSNWVQWDDLPCMDWCTYRTGWIRFWRRGSGWLLQLDTLIISANCNNRCVSGPNMRKSKKQFKMMHPRYLSVEKGGEATREWSKGSNMILTVGSVMTNMIDCSSFQRVRVLGRRSHSVASNAANEWCPATNKRLTNDFHLSLA